MAEAMLIRAIGLTFILADLEQEATTNTTSDLLGEVFHNSTRHRKLATCHLVPCILSIESEATVSNFDTNFDCTKEASQLALLPPIVPSASIPVSSVLFLMAV